MVEIVLKPACRRGGYGLRPKYGKMILVDIRYFEELKYGLSSEIW